MVDESPGQDAAQLFRRAKAEHYLQLAEEYVQMARYNKAQRILNTVVLLDPENRLCRELQKTVAENLAELLERSKNGNGTSADGANGSGAKRKRSELVMVVDQDERLLASLTGTLRKYGFHTIAAGGYDEALETLQSIRPDVVISEVNFESGPRGFDLYLWIKTNSPGQDIPFLFLATRIDRDLLIAGKRFGVDDFMQKPLDNEVVTACIINSLSRRKAVRS